VATAASGDTDQRDTRFAERGEDLLLGRRVRDLQVGVHQHHRVQLIPLVGVKDRVVRPGDARLPRHGNYRAVWHHAVV